MKRTMIAGVMAIATIAPAMAEMPPKPTLQEVGELTFSCESNSQYRPPKLADVECVGCEPCVYGWNDCRW